MANVELGVGYLSIVPETSKIAPGIRQAFGHSEKIAGEAGTSMGSKLAGGLRKTLVGSAVATGAAAAGVLGTAMAKGFQRLSSMDQAEAKLAGLGHSAEAVAGITENALASVKGTAFGLGEAATASAGLVAAGIKPGQELEQTLKTVADTAAIAGKSMADTGVIFGSIAARGKLQGDDMLQLLSAGVPVLQNLSKHLGKSSAEISEMVSKGQIDFATFEAAMRESIGGSALKAGDTFAGSIANMHAALGRFGAEMQKPLFEGIPPVAKGLTAVVDSATTAFTPLAQQLGQTLTPAMERFGGYLVDTVAPGMQQVAEKIPGMIDGTKQWFESVSSSESTTRVMESLKDVFSAVGGIAKDSGGQIASILGTVAQASAQVSAVTWQLLADSLNLLAPAIKQVIETLAAHPGIVTAFVTSLLGLKAVKMVAGPVGATVTAVRNVGGAVRFAHGAVKGATLGEAMLRLAGGFKSANPIIAGIGKTFVAAGRHLVKFGGVAGKLMRVMTPVVKFLGTAVRFVNPWVAGFTLAAGALTLFFTKTEAGRKVWAKLTDVMKDAAAWVKTSFAGVWEKAKNAFNGFVNTITAGVAVVKGVWQGITSGDVSLLDRLGFGESSRLGQVVSQVSSDFELLKTTVTGAWRVIGDTAKTMWETISTVFRSGFEIVKDVFATGWLVMVDVFTGNWRRIPEHLAAGWEAIKGHFQAGVTRVGEIVSGWMARLAEQLGEIKQAWSDRFREIWDRVKDVFSGLRDDLGKLMETIVSSTKARFQDLVAGTVDVVKRLPGEVKNVFRNASEWLKDAGSRIIEGLWSGLKSKWGQVTSWLADVRSAVTGVFSGATASAAQRVGVSYYASGGLAAYANGGRLPVTGPGTDRVDGFLGVTGAGVPIARVDAGEWIINRGSSQKYAAELAAINAGVFPKLPGYASGGIAAVTKQQLIDFARGLRVNGTQASRPLEGAPYAWGGVDWGDCSGTQSALAQFAAGVAPFRGRFATGNEGQALSALGFKSGYGGADSFNIGWVNGGPGGGHTAGDVGDTRFEMGGSRGNGQINGQAVGARNFPHVMHLDLLKVDGIESTSIDGATMSTTSGAAATVAWDSINFGSAGDLWKMALAAQRVGVYDAGGWLPPGGMAVNLSGRPEPVFNAGQWGLLAQLPSAVAHLVGTLEKTLQISNPERVPGWFGGSQVVIDAEKGLLEVRRNVAVATRELPGQEREVAGIRAEIARIERDGGAAQLASAQQVKEAEKQLAEARLAGDPQQLEKAQARYNQVLGELEAQSGDSSDAGRKLAEAYLRLDKAGEKLAKTQVTLAESAAKVEAAERTVAAARVQAAGQMVQTFLGAAQSMAQAMESTMGIAAQLAKNVEAARREVQQLSLQMATETQNLVAARRASQLAEFDGQRQRLSAALAYARANEKLAKLRDKQLDLANRKIAGVGRTTQDTIRRADTSLVALGGAVDRFRETGVFHITVMEEATATAVGSMTSTMGAAIDQTGVSMVGALDATAEEQKRLEEEKAALAREIAAQEQEVKALRFAQLSAEFEAQKMQVLAAFELENATMRQAETAEMLAVAQERLNAQASQFYGMTSQQASRAQKGWGGVGGILGGLGKIVGAVAATAGGFMLGGIPGAIAAGAATIPAALGGVKDLVHGSITTHTYRDDIKESFQRMDGKDKALTILGLGATGVTAAGGAFLAGNGNPVAGNAIAQAAPLWMDITIGSRFKQAQDELERAQSVYEEQTQSLKDRFELQRAQRDAQLANQLAGIQSKMASAQAAEEFFKARAQVERETDPEVKKALAGIADSWKLQHDAMIEIGRDEARRTDAILRQVTAIAEKAGAKTEVTINIPASKSAFSADEVREMWMMLDAQAADVDVRVNAAPGAHAVLAARR